MRVSWIIFTALCTVVLLLSLCAGTVYFASGSGPGVAEPVPPRRKIPVEDVPALQPDLEDFESDGEFNAWLKHPEDVFEPNLMRLSIRLFPNTNEFPGMRKADVNRFDDTVVQVTVALEDISVPLWNTQIANRPQSHLQREKARGREALEFCRRAILNASGLLVVNPRYAKDDRQVHCRLVLLDEAGDRVDLGALLVKNGFGSRDVLDWGRRMPQ